jgi:hypothetical protein
MNEMKVGYRAISTRSRQHEENLLRKKVRTRKRERKNKERKKEMSGNN